MNKNDDIFPSMEDARIERLRKFMHSHYEENKELINSIVPSSGTIPTLPEYVPINYDLPLDGNYTESVTHQEGKMWRSYDS